MPFPRRAFGRPRHLRAALAAGALTAAAAAAAPCAQAQSVYVEGQVAGSALGQLGILDLASGAYTLVGSHATVLSGLALATDGTLYGAASQLSGSTYISTLYTVNRSTGALTSLGAVTTSLSGRRLDSITFGPGGVLYGLVDDGSGTASLAKFTLGGTPTATVASLSPTLHADGGLASDGAASLFATQGDAGLLTDAFGGDGVYRITPPTGPDAVLAQDPGFLQATVFALTFANGSLFGIDNGSFGPGSGSGGIYQIDRSTGAGQQTAAYDTAAAGAITAAANYVAPEPGTLALVAVGLLASCVLGSIRRRRAA